MLPQVISFYFVTWFEKGGNNLFFENIYVIIEETLFLIVLWLWLKLSMTDFEVFVMRCWAVWNDICKLTHTDCSSPRDINVNWVNSMYEAFLVASSNCDNPRILDVCMSDHLWKAPGINKLRMNVDASCNTVNKIYSVVAVIRNSDGNAELGIYF